MQLCEECGLPRGIRWQAGPGDQVSGQHTRHPFLAPTDQHFSGVIRIAPLHRNTEFLEGLVEGRQVPETLGVCEHTIAVENQGRHLTTPSRRCQRLLQALLSLP